MSIFKSTDVVHDYEHGKGKILHFVEDTIIVFFEENRYSRTFSMREAKLRLSFTPYDLIKGGFSQERPKPEIEKGSPVMIQVNELRTGNWVKGVYKHSTEKGVQVLQVESIHDGCINESYFCWGEIDDYITESDLYSIELTGDILLTIGFQKQDNGSFQLDSDLGFTLWSSYGSTVNLYYESDEFGQEIKSLHHLMNVFYFLTGKELQIDLKL